ncbi:MAG: SGNH/GDSL hydrolase family protein [Planctomycetota bacterium]|jgi:hypothetical protein
MCSASITWLLTFAASALPAAGQGRSFDPIFEGGGIRVYVKMDFDAGPNPFSVQGKGTVALVDHPGQTVSGRSLHVERAGPGPYFGARTEQIAVRGTRGLKIAFCVRARGMTHVALNFFDSLRQDNTTPISPARVYHDGWRTVVFAVENFRFNSDPPQIKVKAETEHTSLFFHGREEEGATGGWWIDKLVIYRGRDTQPPELPGRPGAAVENGGRIALAWEEPNDNAFAAVYGVYRRQSGGPWTKIGESIRPRFVDTVSAAGEYAYCVTASDYDNNTSKPSEEIAVRVASAGESAMPAAAPVRDRLDYADNVRKIHAAGHRKVRHDVFLFAGDSITAADVYTHTLGRWLARGIPVRRGVGRMKTAYGKEMIDRYLAEANPEFAVVMYGTNDSKSPQAVAEAMENLTAVIDSCARHGTVPILATIPPRGFDKEKQDDQIRFNTALINLCRQERVPVSYCFEEMMARDLKKMLRDGVHLTSGPGNDAAGEALQKTMEQIYFALRDQSNEWE